jgi:hypothetical protein
MYYDIIYFIKMFVLRALMLIADVVLTTVISLEKIVFCVL